MKVILYMAITVNGMIAKLDNSTNFTSPEDWKSFKKIALQTKAVVIGRNTYNEYLESPELLWRECKFFVLTNDHELKAKFANVEILSSIQPKQVLETIKNQGFTQVCVAGGGLTNANFLKENLMDEVYLDVEPFLYLKGIPLFRSETDFECQLEFLGVKNLSSQTVQLHYKVKK